MLRRSTQVLPALYNIQRQHVQCVRHATPFLSANLCMYCTGAAGVILTCKVTAGCSLCLNVCAPGIISGPPLHQHTQLTLRPCDHQLNMWHRNLILIDILICQTQTAIHTGEREGVLKVKVMRCCFHMCVLCSLPPPRFLSVSLSFYHRNHPPTHPATAPHSLTHSPNTSTTSMFAHPGSCLRASGATRQFCAVSTR